MSSYEPQLPSELDTPMTLGVNGGPSSAYPSPVSSYPSFHGNHYPHDGSLPYDYSFSNDAQLRSTTNQIHHEAQARNTDAVVIGTNEKKRPLACPFSKCDFPNHQACVRFNLSTYNYVIQHIERNHVLKGFYCANCRYQWSKKDDKQKECDDHIRSRSCARASYRETGKLTLEEFNNLKSSDAKSSDTKPQSKPIDGDRWESLWKKLFPGVAVPESPFQLKIASLEHLRRDADQLVLDMAAAHIAAGRDQTLVKNFMMPLLRQFKEALLGSVPATVSSTSTPLNPLTTLHQPAPAVLGIGSPQPVSNTNLAWQLTANNNLHQPSRGGATAQGGGYLNQHLQTPQYPPIDPGMYIETDQGLDGPPLSTIAFPNSPNHQQQGSSPLTPVPGFPRGALNTSYQGRHGTMQQNFVQNSGAQPGFGSDFLSPGQQHPN